DVKRRLEACDAFILASPVYVGNVSGTFKTMADRYAQWWHRPSLQGKPFLCVVTTGGAWAKKTASLLSHNGYAWGGHYTGMVLESKMSHKRRVKAQMLGKDYVKEKEVAEFLRCATQPRCMTVPRIVEIYQFCTMVSMGVIVHRYGPDGAWYRSQGWMDSEGRLSLLYPAGYLPLTHRVVARGLQLLYRTVIPAPAMPDDWTLEDTPSVEAHVSVNADPVSPSPVSPPSTYQCASGDIEEALQ
ncbi:hypothetical protein KIPB_011149, partial [Kipferlia bialata]